MRVFTGKETNGKSGWSSMWTTWRTTDDKEVVSELERAKREFKMTFNKNQTWFIRDFTRYNKRWEHYNQTDRVHRQHSWQNHWTERGERGPYIWRRKTNDITRTMTSMRMYRIPKEIVSSVLFTDKTHTPERVVGQPTSQDDGQSEQEITWHMRVGYARKYYMTQKDMSITYGRRTTYLWMHGSTTPTTGRTGSPIRGSPST
jgi:hypothetical protein